MAGETIEQAVIGEIDGQGVEAFRLKGGETEIEVMTFGAILTRLTRPDRAGKRADIVLGYDDPAAYIGNPGNAGAICGRLSNRLAHGKFRLDGVDYQLPLNSGAHHLHGGAPGFGKRFWQAVSDPEKNAVTFRLHSPDGDQGYPGALDASTTYRLDGDGALELEMRATCTRATVVNLIHHGYWNLAGHGSGSVAAQVLRIPADRITTLTEDKIATGEFLPVAGTAYDFTAARPIGAQVADTGSGPGYDHNFCLTGFDGSLRLAAEASDPASGRALTLFSNQPGLQFYTAAHYRAQPTSGKGGALYRDLAGFALETQAFPNAPNLPDFPSVVLRPQQVYHHRMRVVFSTR